MFLLSISSTFFTIPGIYAFSLGHIGLSTFSFFTAFISTLFWSNPKEGIIRNIDLITSKVSFLIFFYYGFTGVFKKIYREPEKKEYITDAVLGFIISSSLIGCFYMACWLHSIEDPLWVWYHFFFHIQTIYLQVKAIEYVFI